MEHNEDVHFVEFECPETPLPQDIAAEPRPVARPRQTIASSSEQKLLFQSFDCEAIHLPAEVKAEPRPQGRERQKMGVVPSAMHGQEIVEEIKTSSLTDGASDNAPTGIQDVPEAKQA